LDAAQKARDLRPEWDEPYLRLGEVYQRRGEGSLAIEMFEKALEIRPSVEAWCGMGNILRTRGLVDSAEVVYKQAAEHNPNHDRPFSELGQMYWDVNNLEEAERMFRRGIEVRPDGGRSQWGLVELLAYEEGRVREADELIRAFAEEYPYHPEAYEALFYFLVNEGDYPGALEVIEEAVSHNPDRVWPHLLLAEAYAYQMGENPEPEKAVAAVQKALELRPKSGRALRWAGQIYGLLGNPEKALDYYRLALEVSPGSASVLTDMANLLIGQARFDSAAVVAAEGIRQHPGVAQSWGWDNYRHLEAALTHLMRADEFLSVIQDAADRYGRDNPIFYVKLGWEQCLSGQYQEAMNSYNRVLDMRKEGSPIGLWLTGLSLRGLAMAQWLSGDTDGALASFTEATDAQGFGSFAFGRPMKSLLKYLGRFDEMEARLERMREEGMTDEWAWHVIYYYPGMRRFDDALSMVSAVRDSEDVTYKTDLELLTATWYRQKGDLSNAEKVLKDIEPSLPFNYRGKYDLERAALEAVKGDLDGALQFAIKANEEWIGYQYSRNRFIAFLSRLYYARGQTKDAQDVLAEANGFEQNIAAFYLRAQMAVITKSPDAGWELKRALLLATRGSRGDAIYWSFGLARIYAALASARLGDPKRARREIDYAIKLEPERADIAYYAAAAYSLIGDNALAFRWLETSIERGHDELWWARVDPDLDSLRELSRFKEIMNDWDRRLRAMIN
jgi:tetratricopeptide (TPR) repeat protein